MPLDHIPGAVLHIDERHRITKCNDRCQVVFEKGKEEIQGQVLRDLHEEGLFDQETLLKWESAMAVVRNDETGEATEQVTLMPAGKEHSYHLEVTPGVAERPDDEVYCSLSSVGTDQRYNDTLTALHAATRDLMTADDREGVLEQTAVAASEVLGFPGTAVRVYDPDADVLRHVSFGSRVGDLEDRPPYPVSDSPHGEAFRRNETIVDDIVEDDEYDRDVFTQTMYIPIGRTGLLSVGTVGRNFEETDVQFAEILAENAAAAIRVVETATSLRQERERLDLLKQILTRVLRHNIRNDMNVITGNMELIAPELDADNEPVQQALDCANDIIELSEKARQLERIVDSPRSQTPVALQRVVETAVRTVVHRYPDAHIETDVDHEQVRAHETLGLAVENLIENACEHGADDISTVTVATTVDNGSIELTITDDGPGIPAEEIEVLQTEDEDDLWHGSGLGLWIVKLVVDRSGGTIDFDTTQKGTAVTIALPNADGSAPRN